MMSNDKINHADESKNPLDPKTVDGKIYGSSSPDIYLCDATGCKIIEIMPSSQKPLIKKTYF
jgi:hypothetical protein